MKKKLSLSIGTLFILLIACFLFFLHSNLFKKYLTDKLAYKTNKTINISEALSWKFFPKLQLTATHITVADAKTSWLIDKAIVQLNWFNIKPKTIALQNIKVNIKNIPAFSAQGLINVICAKDCRGHFSFNHVELQGVDIPYLISTAQHFLNHHIQRLVNHHQTVFTQLTGSFKIIKGIISNDDLIAHHALFTMTGAGMIDMNSHLIQYHLITIVNKKNNEKNDINNLYGIPLPIIIEGPLNDVQASIDTAVLMNALINQPILKVNGQEVKPKDLIKNLLGF